MNRTSAALAAASLSLSLGLVASAAQAYSFQWLDVDHTEVSTELNLRTATGGTVHYENDWLGDGSELPFARGHSLDIGPGHSSGEGTSSELGTHTRAEIGGQAGNRVTDAMCRSVVERRFRIDGAPGQVLARFNFAFDSAWHMETESGYDPNSVDSSWGLEFAIIGLGPQPVAGRPNQRGGSMVAQDGTDHVTGWINALVETGHEYHLRVGTSASLLAPAAGDGVGGAFSGWFTHDGYFDGVDLPDEVHPVPEPASMGLFGLGLASVAIGAMRRRQRRTKAEAEAGV